MAALVLPERVGVMAIDPGGTTGVACGDVELRQTLAETIAVASWGTYVFDGEPWMQGRDLVELLQEFVARFNLDGGALDQVYVSIEDFQLRQRHADLVPLQVDSAFRTAWSYACPALEMRLVYQQPSDGMRVTDARLRKLGCWVVGSPHKRDAMRHLILRVNRIMEGRG
jgi:hypothetical protein